MRAKKCTLCGPSFYGNTETSTKIPSSDEIFIINNVTKNSWDITNAADDNAIDEIISNESNNIMILPVFIPLTHSLKAAIASVVNLDSKTLVFAFDLQRILPTPFLSTNTAYYRRQLSTYNLTIHNCIKNASVHCMWHVAVSSRGANDISSCLFKILTRKHSIGCNQNNILFRHLWRSE